MPDAPFNMSPPTPEPVAMEPQTESTPQTEGDSILQTAQPSDAAPQRPRDEHGRFLPTTPQEPSGPQIDPALQFAAKDLYFTDDEINKLAAVSPAALQSAIHGRRYELSQRHGGQQFQQQQTQQQPSAADPAQAAFEDFNVTIPDHLSEELAPVKGLAEYVNKLKASVMTENQQLKKELAEIKGYVEQSARVARTEQEMQADQASDELAAKVPGLIEALGKPSQAKRAMGSEQGLKWQMLAPAIKSVTERYVNMLGPDRITDDVALRILTEAWEASGFSKHSTNGNGRSFGPGAVVRPTPSRTSNGREAGPTGDPELDRTHAILSDAWSAYGGNPFARELSSS